MADGHHLEDPPATTAGPAPGPDRPERRFVALFWRLFIPNVAVLLAAGIVLWLQPANGRFIALAAGVAAMALVNVLLMRRAFAPLERLTTFMERIDPLRPGQRVPVLGPESEVSMLARAFNGMLDRVEEERRQSARRELAAQEAERKRIARELHDEVGQNLTALAMLLNRIGRDGDGPLDARLDEARRATLATVEDVRRLARELRPVALDELGLVAALTALCEGLSQRTGLRIARDFPAGLPPLAPEAEVVVYRVAQESLTNVLRHAAAGTAEVSLRVVGDALLLRVADDGVGLRGAVKSGGGIRGMRERALLVEGDLLIEESAAGGVAVALRVPLRGASR